MNSTLTVPMVEVDWVPSPEDILPPPPGTAVADLRRAAYAAESDHLFFAWQAGEIPKSAWRDARQAIKDRFPKGVQDA